MKFISKPVTIEAVQYTGDNKDEILAFAKPHAYVAQYTGTLRLRARGGEVSAKPGDWIVANEYEAYPVEDSVMQEKYRPVIPITDDIFPLPDEDDE